MNFYQETIKGSLVVNYNTYRKIEISSQNIKYQLLMVSLIVLCIFMYVLLRIIMKLMLFDLINYHN